VFSAAISGRRHTGAGDRYRVATRSRRRRAAFRTATGCDRPVAMR
jgi:hypothetical protein